VVQFAFKRFLPPFSSSTTVSFLVSANHSGDLNDKSGGRFEIDEIRFFGAELEVAAHLQAASPEPTSTPGTWWRVRSASEG